jgi:hypothetical protein
MSRWSAVLVAIVLISGLVIAAMAFTRSSDSDLAGPPPGPAPAGKVWSPEHGHYH